MKSFAGRLVSEAKKTKNLCELCVFAVRYLVAAAGGGILSLDPGLNNIGRASDPGGYSDRFGGAVFGAGTALHTPV